MIGNATVGSAGIVTVGSSKFNSGSVGRLIDGKLGIDGIGGTERIDIGKLTVGKLGNAILGSSMFNSGNVGKLTVGKLGIDGMGGTEGTVIGKATNGNSGMCEQVMASWMLGFWL